MINLKEMKKLEVFSIFDDKHLEELTKATEIKDYKAKEHVYERGEKAKHLFVVINGLVSMRRLEPGQERGISFETRTRGEIFGTACLMDPQEYTLTALCLEDTQVYAIDVDKLFDLFGEEPWLGYKMMRKVAEVYFERYKGAKRALYATVKEPTVITALPG